ncbi:MAG: TetR/AcrR family transcriptional regulator [Pseudomonadales bacterium]
MGQISQSSTASDRRRIDAKTWEKLRRTVIDLFAAGLFHEVGIRDIAKQAGVGPQTIYKYFGTKEELVFRSCERELQQLTEHLQQTVENNAGDTEAQFAAFNKTFVEFYVAHRQIAQIIYMNIPMRNLVANPEYMQHAQIKILTDLLSRGQQQGSVRTDAAPEVLVNLLAGALGRHLVSRIMSGDDLIPRQEAATVQQLLWPLVMV